MAGEQLRNPIDQRLAGVRQRRMPLAARQLELDTQPPVANRDEAARTAGVAQPGDQIGRMDLTNIRAIRSAGWT